MRQVRPPQPPHARGAHIGLRCRRCNYVLIAAGVALGCLGQACATGRDLRDDGRCPTARGNDRLRAERDAAAVIGSGLPPAPPRPDFNLAAAGLNLPFQWRDDDNHDGRVDPRELAFVPGAHPPGGTEADWILWVAEDVNLPSATPFFTQRFVDAYRAILAMLAPVVE